MRSVYRFVFALFLGTIAFSQIQCGGGKGDSCKFSTDCKGPLVCNCNVTTNAKGELDCSQKICVDGLKVANNASDLWKKIRKECEEAAQNPSLEKTNHIKGSAFLYSKMNTIFNTLFSKAKRTISLGSRENAEICGDMMDVQMKAGISKLYDMEDVNNIKFNKKNLVGN